MCYLEGFYKGWRESCIRNNILYKHIKRLCIPTVCSFYCLVEQPLLMSKLGLVNLWLRACVFCMHCTTRFGRKHFCFLAGPSRVQNESSTSPSSSSRQQPADTHTSQSPPVLSISEPHLQSPSIIGCYRHHIFFIFHLVLYIQYFTNNNNNNIKEMRPYNVLGLGQPLVDNCTYM